MDDSFILQQLKTTKNLLGEAANDRKRESLKRVCTYELVQINAEARRDDAKMGAEVEARRDRQRGVAAIGILDLSVRRATQVEKRERSTYPVLELFQDIDFNQRLLMKPLLVPDDLDSHQTPHLVVDAANNLAEAALAEEIDNLVPISEMVTHHDRIVAAFVIVAKVGSAGRGDVADVLLG